MSLLIYKVENKKLVINEDSAPLVKYAFDEYAKGTSQKNIITCLKNHALPSDKNRAFTFHQLNSVIITQNIWAYVNLMVWL